MKTPSDMPRLKGYRFPREIISYAVWAYYRFALSTADVEDLLAERRCCTDRPRFGTRPTRDGFQAVRSKCGRPRRVIRFRIWTPILTSVF